MVLTSTGVNLHPNLVHDMVGGFYLKFTVTFSSPLVIYLNCSILIKECSLLALGISPQVYLKS